ncbi:hypothetical protein FNV43_RR09957 [Rhamnella rubrinervis]|uniref:Endonuclease/exonuclease/phosphatase domain-containing protein n=1 Tax=Rhamnella rubrinervis TaxID=2594499 RepID=A0A8K0HBP3_9ROSA|nr:hypothetical protein FNV43_RR09957 [Rhamnella rubrinervis]
MSFCLCRKLPFRNMVYFDAIAMVVHDHKGKLIFLASKFLPLIIPYAAKSHVIRNVFDWLGLGPGSIVPPEGTRSGRVNSTPINCLRPAQTILESTTKIRRVSPLQIAEHHDNGGEGGVVEVFGDSSQELPRVFNTGSSSGGSRSAYARKCRSWKRDARNRLARNSESPLEGGFSVTDFHPPGGVVRCPRTIKNLFMELRARAKVFNYLRAQVKKYRPSCIFLSETKSSEERMVRFCRRLGFEHCEVSAAKGFVGGIILMWRNEVNLKVVWKSDRVICGEVSDCNDGGSWRLLGCYGPPIRCQKDEFWDELGMMVHMEERPWILLGDLNEVTEANEKWGGRDLHGRKLFLKKFMEDAGAIDLGFVGRPFTWERRVNGNVIIKERLDRAVANHDWICGFPEAVVEHLAIEVSDHAPILINLAGKEEKWSRPFRFLKAWTNDKSSFKVVRGGWEAPMGDPQNY